MIDETQATQSHLFTVRVWRAETGSAPEWRGKLQHILTGEASYFRSWDQLINLLVSKIQEMEVETMTTPLNTNGVHHLALTVSDVRRSQQFYTDLLGFKFVTDFGERALLHNGSVLLALTPPADPTRAISADRFNENRIGLDHLSLGVASMAELQAAASLFDAQGVEHGEVKPLEPFGIAVLAFRDPDNIQVELTAPLA